MTCIVGLADKGTVYVGGDSAGVAGWDMTVRADQKVFQRGDVLLGFTTSFRMGQLLRYRLQSPPHPAGMETEEYLATVFVDAVRDCLKDGGWAQKEKDQEQGGTFIIGYRGTVWTVHDDYQVAAAEDGFTAVGCGDQAARGALYATRGQPAAKRMRLALEAAERLSAGVRAPFQIKALRGAKAVAV